LGTHLRASYLADYYSPSGTSEVKLLPSATVLQLALSGVRAITGETGSISGALHAIVFSNSFPLGAELPVSSTILVNIAVGTGSVEICRSALLRTSGGGERGAKPGEEKVCSLGYKLAANMQHRLHWSSTTPLQDDVGLRHVVSSETNRALPGAKSYHGLVHLWTEHVLCPSSYRLETATVAGAVAASGVVVSRNHYDGGSVDPDPAQLEAAIHFSRYSCEQSNGWSHKARLAMGNDASCNTPLTSIDIYAPHYSSQEPASCGRSLHVSATTTATATHTFGNLQLIGLSGLSAVVATARGVAVSSRNTAHFVSNPLMQAKPFMHAAAAHAQIVSERTMDVSGFALASHKKLVRGKQECGQSSGRSKYHGANKEHTNDQKDVAKDQQLPTMRLVVISAVESVLGKLTAKQFKDDAGQSTFLQMGMDSLSAMEICEIIRVRLQVAEVPPHLPFDYPSVTELTGALVDIVSLPTDTGSDSVQASKSDAPVNGEQREAYPATVGTTTYDASLSNVVAPHAHVAYDKIKFDELLRSNEWPLSPEQHLFWSHYAINPTASCYNMSCVQHLVDVPLDPAILDTSEAAIPLLTESLRFVLRQHSGARVNFAADGSHFRVVPNDEVQAFVECIAAYQQSQFVCAPFDLVSSSRSVAVRAALVRPPTSDDANPTTRAECNNAAMHKWSLLLTAHHIVVDARSLMIMLNEMREHFTNALDAHTNSNRRGVRSTALELPECSQALFAGGSVSSEDTSFLKFLLQQTQRRSIVSDQGRSKSAYWCKLLTGREHPDQARPYHAFQLPGEFSLRRSPLCIRK
jgi:hypothetical protein